MNKIRIGVVSLCSIFLLAACGTPSGDVTTNSSADDTTVSTMESMDTADTVASSDSSADSATDSSTDSTNPDSGTEKGIQNHTFGLSLTDALNHFTKEFGEMSIESVELKQKYGKYVYEVEGFDASKEYELSIDAETGDILNKKQENDDSDHSNEAIQTEGILSPEEAMKKALDEAGEGAYVTDWELEMENGRTGYEVEIAYPGSDQKDFDITIDAENGEILDR